MVIRAPMPRVAAVVFLGSTVVMAGVTALSAQAPPVVLRVGETAPIQGLNVAVTFDAVRSDSRCPTDARCIRAGEAVVALKLRFGDSAAAELTLAVPPGGGASEASGSYTITVVALEPQARSEVGISQGDYRVTVRVEEQ